jgi:uncharacterized C2H2 Zn-finger protein
MARSRRAAKPEATADGNIFTCPECGKTFDRAASLGAHRRRAHGVAGSSKSAAGNRSTTGASPRRGRRSAASRSNGSTRSAAPTRPSLDRDQLLKTLFPKGVPPREDVIRRVGNWLDEAEQLAGLPE